MTKRPTAWWYAVAAVFAVLGLGTAVALGSGVVGSAKDAKIHRLASDGTITIGEPRVAVYADRSNPVGFSSAGSAMCTARPRSGGRAIVFADPSSQVRINDWVRIALVPTGTAPGSYILTCAGIESSISADELGYGNNPRVASILVRTIAAVVIGLGGVIIALVIAIITAVRQHSARRRRPLEPPHGPTP